MAHISSGQRAFLPLRTEFSLSDEPSLMVKKRLLRHRHMQRLRGRHLLLPVLFQGQPSLLIGSTGTPSFVSLK